MSSRVLNEGEVDDSGNYSSARLIVPGQDLAVTINGKVGFPGIDRCCLSLAGLPRSCSEGRSEKH